MDMLTSGFADDNAFRIHMLNSAAYMKYLTLGLILVLVLRLTPRFNRKNDFVCIELEYNVSWIFNFNSDNIDNEKNCKSLISGYSCIFLNLSIFFSKLGGNRASSVVVETPMREPSHY